MSANVQRPSHDHILAAAEEVFAAKGLGAASLRDLLNAAGCSTTAFYARFASKNEVLVALVRELLEDLHDAAAEALPRARDLRSGWDQGVDILVATLSDRKALVKVALTEAPMIPEARAALSETYAALATLLSTQLRRVGRRNVDVDDADALAWAIVGALTMQITRWAVFDQLDDSALTKTLRTTAHTLLPRRRHG
jgi:AcrR family transcriptional regulator